MFLARFGIKNGLDKNEFFLEIVYLSQFFISLLFLELLFEDYLLEFLLLRDLELKYSTWTVPVTFDPDPILLNILI